MIIRNGVISRSTNKADDNQSKRQSKYFFPQVEVAKPLTNDKAVASALMKTIRDRVMNKRKIFGVSKLISRD
jgi:hypothetical protein